MAARLHRTSTAGSQTTWTFSGWFKRSKNGSGQQTINSATDGNNWTQCYFGSDDTFKFKNYVSSSTTGSLETNRKFRDPAAWYHIVLNWDTTNASAGDRMRIYVNGVEETSFSSDVNPGSSVASNMNTASSVTALGGTSLGSEDFDGVMAHCHFIDGTIYAPTAFAETDATSGIWIAKTSPSVTYGTNGWFLKFASGAITTDSSGEGNTMTQVGTITTTKDTPDNNFCTLNPLANFNSGGTYSNGNTKWVTATDGSTRYNISSVGLVAGKWYCEVKMKQSNTSMIGITDKEQPDSSEAMTQTNYGAAYKSNDGKYIVNGGSATTYGDSYTTDDIVGIYLDLDNNKLYFGKNGTVQNSGTGITITGISAMTAPTASSQYCYFMGGTKDNGGSTFEFNFGNGYFGTDAVTSGVADAGGEGTFEYDPSSGTFDGSSKDFRAICTNNIATYGG